MTEGVRGRGISKNYMSQPLKSGEADASPVLRALSFSLQFLAKIISKYCPEILGSNVTPVLPGSALPICIMPIINLFS